MHSTHSDRIGARAHTHARTHTHTAQLKYTAGKYFTPSGRCIQSKTYKGAGPGIYIYI